MPHGGGRRGWRKPPEPSDEHGIPSGLHLRRRVLAHGRGRPRRTADCVGGAWTAGCSPTSASGRVVMRRDPAGRSTFCCASPTTSSREMAGLRRTSPVGGCFGGLEDYPRFCQEFRDSDGRPPRHTFFYPIESTSSGSRCAGGVLQTRPRRGGDPPPSRPRHFGKPASDPDDLQGGSGTEPWPARPASRDGRGRLRLRARKLGIGQRAARRGLCGVNDEIEILKRTGCYADFTLPSAPDPTQTRKINSIYYAVDDPHRPKSHDSGTDLGSGTDPRDGLMIVQGPLVLDWRRPQVGDSPSDRERLSPG